MSSDDASPPDPPRDRPPTSWEPTGFENDADPSRRRARTLVFVGIPTVAASMVVLLLGLPWWILLGFLALFALIVITNS